MPKNTISLGFKQHPNWKMLVCKHVPTWVSNLSAPLGTFQPPNSKAVSFPWRLSSTTSAASWLPILLGFVGSVVGPGNPGGMECFMGIVFFLGGGDEEKTKSIKISHC